MFTPDTFFQLACAWALEHERTTVEDEEFLRDVIATGLRANGYDVTEAGDGVEALGLMTEQTAFQVLISDVIMPRMGGTELAIKLTEINPSLKVFLMSGTETHPDVAYVAIEFFRKPFAMRSLIAGLNRLEQ